MRSFLGLLVGLVVGFLIVPVSLGIMGDTDVGAGDALGALFLAMFGGVVGAIVGASTGRKA